MISDSFEFLYDREIFHHCVLFSSAVTSTMWPQWNMDGNFELGKAGNKWESSIDAGFTDTPRRIKWTQSLTNTSNRNKVAFDFTARFRCPMKVSVHLVVCIIIRFCFEAGEQMISIQRCN